MHTAGTKQIFVEWIKMCSDENKQVVTENKYVYGCALGATEARMTGKERLSERRWHLNEDSK